MKKEQKGAVLERKLWIGLVELRPLDPESFGFAGAYTHIVTWAVDSVEFRSKAGTIASTLNLFVTCVENEEPVARRLEKWTPGEDVADMIERAESNPNAIIYGNFHYFRFDQG